MSQALGQTIVVQSKSGPITVQLQRPVPRLDKIENTGIVVKVKKELDSVLPVSNYMPSRGNSDARILVAPAKFPQPMMTSTRNSGVRRPHDSKSNVIGPTSILIPQVQPNTITVPPLASRLTAAQPASSPGGQLTYPKKLRSPIADRFASKPKAKRLEPQSLANILSSRYQTERSFKLMHEKVEPQAPLQYYFHARRAADADYKPSAIKKPATRNMDRSKGLRHFSTKVCDKVREKGITTYNEVADELVAAYFDLQVKTGSVQSAEQKLYDRKNIRRRVYDALNVLMALNIIRKEKKEIQWVGLPTNSAQEYKKLISQKDDRLERIRMKLEQLHELMVQQVVFKNLVERNQFLEDKEGGPPPENTTLSLPYVVVNTDKKTVVDCSISQDKAEYLFTFNRSFEIHDDVEVLKRMGLSCGMNTGNIDLEGIDYRIKRHIPVALHGYVDQIAKGQFIVPAPKSSLDDISDDDYPRSLAYDWKKPIATYPLSKLSTPLSVAKYQATEHSSSTSAASIGSSSQVPIPKSVTPVVVSVSQPSASIPPSRIINVTPSQFFQMKAGALESGPGSELSFSVAKGEKEFTSVLNRVVHQQRKNATDNSTLPPVIITKVK